MRKKISLQEAVILSGVYSIQVGKRRKGENRGIMHNIGYCIYCMRKKESKETICPYCHGDSGEYRPHPHCLLSGTILNGRYLIGRVLGEGGFGITYISRDLNLDFIVAVKEYYPFGYVNRISTFSKTVSVTEKMSQEEYEEGKRKMMEEARVLAKFCGLKGIVGVRDFFLCNNTAYVVMDYLDGCTLKDHLKKNPILTFEDTVKLLKPIAEALGKVHEAGVIHRDISPDNIMLLKDGSARLLDFGAARNVADGDGKSLSVILKRGYAPEEQYRSQGKQGAWTDVYALSAVIYRCITGRVPEESIQRYMQDTMKLPSELGFKIPWHSEQVLAKGLAVKQENRYQSVKELWGNLTAVPSPVKTEKVRGRIFFRSAWIIAATSTFLLTSLLLGKGGEFAGWMTGAYHYAMLQRESYEQEETENGSARQAVIDDAGDFSFSLDGISYQIPLELSSFLNTGWELEREEDGAPMDVGEQRYLYLHKNESTIYVMVENGYDLRLAAAGCSVIWVTLSQDGLKSSSLILPCEIELGITRKRTVERVLGGPFSSQTGEQMEMLSYSPKNSNGYWHFWFDGNTQILKEVAVSNMGAKS